MKTLNIRRRFSLLELLICVAVLSILISLLLPALAKARRSVQDVSCKTRMKQIGIAQASYSGDFENWVVSTPKWAMILAGGKIYTNLWSTWENLARRGPYGLSLFAPQRKTMNGESYVMYSPDFRCPGEDLPASSPEASHYKYIDGYRGLQIGANPYLIGTDAKPNNDYYKTGKQRKNSSISAPSMALFAGDLGRKEWESNTLIIEPGYVSFRHGAGDSRNIDELYTSNFSALQTTIPAGKGNCLFFDGHVSSVSAIQMVSEKPNYEGCLLMNSKYFFKKGFVLTGWD